MIIFNIEKYGDFDMLGTSLLMASPDGMGKKTAYALAKEAEEMFGDTSETDGIVRYLQDWGFRTVKSISVPIGGNL